MVDIGLVDGISLITGLISITLALVAMWFSRNAERDSRGNYERTKNVLADINEKSAIIETTVTTAQKQLLDSVTKILEETAIPQKVSPDEQMGTALLQLMSHDPDSFGRLMQTMAPYMQQNTTQSAKTEDE